jgi:glycosyltransferase involved in cell wall biosynthesis
MRYLFLGLGEGSASTRYRILQYLPYLRSRGIEFRVETIPGAREERVELISSIASDEVVVLHRRLFPPLEFRRLVEKSCRLVYDFDDAVMYPDSFSGKKRSRTREGRFRRTIEASSSVIAGNEYLKGKAEALGARVSIIPTPVDTEKYSPAETETGEGITLGWLGSRSTLPYIERLMPVLEKVAAANPGLKLKIICDRPLGGASIRVENVPWSLEKEVEELRSFHIGLMPLSDDPWARGKCGFKLLQYMAVGVPAVASPVGVNSRIIEEGVNGFLALNDEEWVEKLNILINDPGLRAAMGENGRRTVEERYSLAVNAPLFLDAISGCRTHNARCMMKKPQ